MTRRARLYSSGVTPNGTTVVGKARRLSSAPSQLSTLVFHAASRIMIVLLVALVVVAVAAVFLRGRNDAIEPAPNQPAAVGLLMTREDQTQPEEPTPAENQSTEEPTPAAAGELTIELANPADATIEPQLRSAPTQRWADRHFASLSDLQ